MSTPPPPAAPSPRRDRPANRWHRNAGVAAVAVLVYLLVTGLPLQFSSQLGLGQQHVSAAWILDWYGLQAPHAVVQSGEVTQVGELLFFDTRTLTFADALVGAVSLTDFVLVAGRHELLLVPRDGAANPEPTHLQVTINRIGSRKSAPYVDTDAGVLAGDTALLNWNATPISPAEIEWAQAAELAGPQAAAFRERFRVRMLTTERCLQDLHSGRFFGTAGVVIVDIASALLLVLAATGLNLWWRYRRS